METLLFDEQLASKYAKNILDNGGFEIWQRGTSFTNPANNSYTVDRFRLGKGGTIPPIVDIARELTVIRPNSEYSMKINMTSAGSDNPNFDITQIIENYKQFKGNTLSLSVWIYSTFANKIRILFFDGTTVTYSLYHQGTGWEKLTVTTAIPTNATTLWVRVFDMGVNETVVGTYYIDNAMLIIGSQPVDYVLLNPAEDWDRCLRYYEVAKAEISAFNGDASWHDLSTTIIYNAKKASIPTVSLNPGGIAFVGDADTSGFLLRRYTAPGTYATWVGTYTAEVI